MNLRYKRGRGRRQRWKRRNFKALITIAMHNTPNNKYRTKQKN